ncbi:serine protein kinase [Aspergillus ellipticus CBS 707.79]|uniref:non-specific serine/threonine protein kinase n=1 Tax=Aspergillus ellipticus CBS 707.79 TaxID=1448320 RepID=A0A319CV58_9EURO|nr:serine protein kinase [Aspergillus ellipticus CBS 707.79]
MRRFERIHDIVEPVEGYRRGGYHPVHLHDIYNQRYEIIGKLSHGQFSTVWLAYDRLLQQHVALKTLKADASKNNKELSTLRHLSATNPDHPGKRHVLELLDYFEHDGPNGTHLCLVLPVMVSDGEGMTVNGKSHEATYVRSISKQILLGLDFLHTLSIVHCDLQPANIMVSTEAAAHSETFLQPPEFNPARWLKGMTADESAPNYLIATQRRRGQLDSADWSELSVKIGDLGGGGREGNHRKSVAPTALRVPELIHQNKTWNASIDAWALGCLICELATNEPLFPLGIFGLSAEQIDHEHLSLIGGLLDGDGQINETFVKHLTDRLPPDFGAENIQHLASFLGLMLQQDPLKRMSTVELLKHPFLVGDIEG